MGEGKAPIDSNQYEVKQVWFNSKDGTRVPMFIVSKKGMVLNGKNPTLLTGYGGFNVSRTPTFERSVFRGWNMAASTLMPTFGVVANSERSGTLPACSAINKTSLTTLLQPPSI